MSILLREYQDKDILSMVEIWNRVVEEANAFPQMEALTAETAKDFFSSQSHTGVIVDDDEVLGLYILHPNNIGRCGHIANASFAVKHWVRGRGIGERLVRDCIKQGHRLGFKLLQFNAVVSTNAAAIRLYEKIGFHRIGTIPNGFLLADGKYTDIILYYIEL